jgi:hypothetical protein
VRTRVVPTGLTHLFHFTGHFRAGLSHPAAARLEFWWCLLHRSRSMVVLTQSKSLFLLGLNGTAEAVPYPKPFMRPVLSIQDLRRSSNGAAFLARLSAAIFRSRPVCSRRAALSSERVGS